MKHHVEAIISVPVCVMGGKKFINEGVLPCCCGEDYCEYPCDLFSPAQERNGVRLVGGSCVCLRFVEKRIAFDCTSYEYDKIDGFKSRGRHYETDNIPLLKIDGEIIVNTVSAVEPAV